MKKLVLSLFILVMVTVSVFAQNRTVTGTVTGEGGAPIPGASVKVKGTSLGSTTNADGKFSISVPANATTLTISYLGYTAMDVTIPSNGVVTAALQVDNAQDISEVTIQGAYGSKQTPRSSATNLQILSGDKLNTVRSTDVNNALAGKVAGIQVRSQATAALGRGSSIRLRGASGFGSGAGVLYVVDGTILPDINDINLDDVEDLSVLQGPAASAILGSQGANGAILITTKKGKNSGGAGLTVNVGTTFESIYRLPAYQDVYAGGASANLMTYTWNASQPVEWQALNGKKYPDYSDDSSWGPKMDGSEYIPWYAWYPGTQYSYKTASLTPRPDNIRDFFQTGATYNNSITYSTASDKMNFKINYTNQYTDGLIPTQYLKKNTLNLNGNYNITNKLSVNANINFVNTFLNGQINDGYSNQTTGGFNQWMHRDLDMGIMKELRGLTVDGPNGTKIYASWNHSNPDIYTGTASIKDFYAGNYWYNFYTYLDLTDFDNNRNRLYGNLTLSYQFTKDFKLNATYRKQQNVVWGETRFSTKLFDSQTQATGNESRNKGYYATSESYSNRENYELTANYSKKIKDFTIDALGGLDFFTAISKGNSANTVDGLVIPDVFRITNSKTTPSIGNSRSAERYRAVFVQGQFGYKNYLFLNGTIRGDWYSVLPQDHNNIFSKSVGASFVFSELLNKANMPWLSEAKLRGSWGEIPKTIGVYDYPGFDYPFNAVQWNGNLLMQTPNGLVDPDIRGAVATSKEIGLDLKFFNRRLTASGTLWDNSEVGLPTTVTINGASGFTSVQTNVGRINKKGLEVQLGGTPIRSKDFVWTINANYGYLIDNKVVELSDKYGVTRSPSVASNSFANLPQVYHVKGMQWGQLFGTGIARNSDGVPIVDANGYYTADPNVYFGSVEPKHTGGVQNNFTIMNMFDVSANIDWQIGGKFASLSEAFGAYSGLTERTAVLNDKGVNVREPVSAGGGVHVVGVLANGTPSDKYVPAANYFANLWSRRTVDSYITDLTFVKLREVAISYRIPLKALGLQKSIQNASISLIARNPVIIYSKTKSFDPSEISGVAGESGQFPSTRGFGFNLKVGF